MNQQQTAEIYSLTDALDDVEIQVLEGTALTSLRRAELDRQGDTARTHRRSITGFRKRLTEYCTYSREVAASCIYSLPRGGKQIQGPTVRFAELVLQAWGNVDVTVTLISVDADAAELQGRCTDHETNVSTALVCRRPVQCKKDQDRERYMKRLKDAKQLAVASGTSIAKRNAVLSVVPKVFWEAALHDAANASLGDGTLTDRRTRALDWFIKEAGATEEQVYAAVEREGFDDVTLDDLRYLSGIRTSLKNKTVSLEEALRPPSKEKPRGPSRAKSSSLGEKMGDPPHDPKTGEVYDGK